jgi:hypothetical protein
MINDMGWLLLQDGRKIIHVPPEGFRFGDGGSEKVLDLIEEIDARFPGARSPVGD